jgi:hypothetical protein
MAKCTRVSAKIHNQCPNFVTMSQNLDRTIAIQNFTWRLKRRTQHKFKINMKKLSKSWKTTSVSTFG